MGLQMEKAALRFLNKSLHELTRAEERVLRRFIERKHVTRNTNAEFHEDSTFGARLADRVAAVGGSWTFIIGFGVVMVTWVGLNSFFLARSGEDFDPYPYILLNLVLSMMASLQAPVIMMSQNRQSAKDRLDASHDYEINLKAEIEVLELHRKMDTLREQQWAELLVLQQEQIRLLNDLLQRQGATATEGKDAVPPPPRPQ